MTTITSPTHFIKADNIPYVTADEAHQLMRTELDRFLALIETLKPEDWGKSTMCSEWNVRDILAHQAGGYAGGSGYIEMFRQARNKPEPGQLMEDAVNAFQLRERADKTPQELIAELRHVGPLAARKWAYRFRPLKPFSLPHRDAGRLSFRHLMWVIHSRDTWMHRLDVCRATKNEFMQTAEHDGRIAELVMLDVADNLDRKYEGPTLGFHLTGIAGGTWKVGSGEPAATIQMDVLAFNIFASGRYTYEEARPMMTITGDTDSAENALQEILVVY